jgi:octaprenyl-diphosphate synthase
MGGGSPQQIEALRAFGDAYGIAFQMNDDLLDMTADERSLGKPVGNDLTERKMTIPLVLALRGGNRDFFDAVSRFYQGGGDGQLPAIVAAIGEQGGFEATREQIAMFATAAKHALEPLPQTAAKEELLRLADGLVN